MICENCKGSGLTVKGVKESVDLSAPAPLTRGELEELCKEFLLNGCSVSWMEMFQIAAKRVGM